MLPCMVCKHVEDDEDSSDEKTPTTKSYKAAKEEVKSLTSQLKDVVLKVSAAYRQCRPCSSSIGRGEQEEFTGTSEASSEEWTAKSSNRKPSSVASSASESTINNNSGPVILQDDSGMEWVAQVEPGVLITFIALSNGENELKRIRFSREMFNKWQAEAWWSDHCDRVHELYNVSSTDKSFPCTRKEASQDQEKEICRENAIAKSVHDKAFTAAATQPFPQPVTKKNGQQNEWVEEDEPGVYITVKLQPGGNRELKRVRFSREKFSEKQAKQWWERNRFRIHDQYL